MAEVRKKVVDDKFNTSSIKIKEKKSTKQRSNLNEEIKETNNIGFCGKIKKFVNGLKSEIKKVRWTNKKDMVKYSIATVFFIIFCSVFFYAIDVIFALIQSLFK